MIALYKEQAFNIETSSPVDKFGVANIWRYTPVRGFSTGKTKKGIVYFEKNINVADADAIFNVAFSAKWEGEWCGVEYSGYSKKIELWSNDTEFAKQHGFEEDERGSYFKIVPLDECSAFRMKVDNILKKKISFIPLKLTQFQSYWRAFVDDLTPNENRCVTIYGAARGVARVAVSENKKKDYALCTAKKTNNRVLSKSTYAEHLVAVEKKLNKSISVSKRQKTGQQVRSNMYCKKDESL